MLKNVGGQAIGSQVIDRNTGAAFTGPVTVYVTGDGGTQGLGLVNSGICEAEGNGYYSYRPAQQETNYQHVAFTFIGALAIPVTVTVVTITEAQAAVVASATVTTVIGDGPTRIELLHQLAHRLNKTPPPNMDSATEARLGSYLNQRQRRLLTMPGMTRLRDATTSFLSVPDEPNYGLGSSIAKISRVFETANEHTLYEMSLEEYRQVAPNPQTISGTPEAFVWRGRQAVMRQPSDPSSLWVQSSYGGDLAVVVYLEGEVEGGYKQATSITLNGTTPAQVGVATTWTRVDKLFLSVPPVGHVTLMEDDSTTPPLALIAAGTTTTVYTGLSLYPAPSAATTYYVDITRAVTDMVVGTDMAAIPEDFADLLVLGALADEYQHLSDPRWSAAIAEYKEREKQLRSWLAETATGRPFGLARPYQRPSQLGVMFPAGT